MCNLLRILFCCFTFLLDYAATNIAQAAPPPVDSEDYKIMHPYAEWVTGQHDRQGYWCCDIGDGRPVDALICAGEPILDLQHMKNSDDKKYICPIYSLLDTKWWVHIEPKHFPAELDHWAPVPDEKITRGGNPTGQPILWLLSGSRIQCFAPPDGV